MNGKLGREEECGEKREERERIFNYIYLNFFEFSLSLSLSLDFNRRPAQPH